MESFALCIIMLGKFLHFSSHFFFTCEGFEIGSLNVY